MINVNTRVKKMPAGKVFPKLMICEPLDLVVAFYSASEGSVISAGRTMSKPFSIHTDFCMEGFVDYEGTLELSND